MKSASFHRIDAAISDDRLEPYFRHVFPAGKPIAPSDYELIRCYALYMWNTALSESLYPALQAIEITLRNGIHNAVSSVFKNEYWYDSIVAEKNKRPLDRVKERLTIDKMPLTPSRIVAGLTFGFWVSLFYRSYEGILWPKLLQEVFPNIPRTLRTRRIIVKRLQLIQTLRNRVSHHEPIWHWANLTDQHQGILEAIEWLNPTILELVTPFDRFQDVHRDGLQRCEKILTSKL